VACVLNNLCAVNEHMQDSFRELKWFFECGGVADGGLVEHGDVGEESWGERASCDYSGALSGLKGYFPDGTCEREDMVISHKLAEQAGEGSVVARVDRPSSSAVKRH